MPKIHTRQRESVFQPYPCTCACYLYTMKNRIGFGKNMSNLSTLGIANQHMTYMVFFLRMSTIWILCQKNAENSNPAERKRFPTIPLHSCLLSIYYEKQDRIWEEYVQFEYFRNRKPTYNLHGYLPQDVYNLNIVSEKCRKFIPGREKAFSNHTLAFRPAIYLLWKRR